MRRRPAPSGARAPGTRPLRQLVLLFGTALGALALFGAAVAGTAPRPAFRAPGALYVAADSDSVAVTPPAAAAADTTRPDTSRVARYFPRRSADARSAAVFGREARPFVVKPGRYWTHQIRRDSTGLYVAREQVAGEDVRIPRRMTFDEYRRARLIDDMADNWTELAASRARMQQNQRAGLGFNFVVPGGRQSAFSTIFGKPQVDLRVNGTAYIQAGFNYRKSDQQVAVTGSAARTDPTFKQDLQLGIVGTIGDKLNVNVSWDTKNQFDYQNQLHLEYQGYEDEIVQRIEAGNVFLNTPSTLIRGGQSLFGIKSEFQLGGLSLTTVASQQEGQANSLAISGGSEAVEFFRKPTNYDDGIHFFLGYYFRNRWEPANADPTVVIRGPGFGGLVEIEVWKRDTSLQDENVRQAVAVVDLGESPQILTQAGGFTREELPHPDIDQYSDAELEQALRTGGDLRDYLEGQKGLTSADWETGPFKRLVRGQHYDFHPDLGYISLKQSLQDGEALAVSFRYLSGSSAVTVGDMAAETGGASGGIDDRRLVLKLLRPAQLKQPGPGFDPAAWYLEMRNIYRLGPYNINLDEFDLRVVYEPPGKTESERLDGVPGRQTLLQLLGLDRVNNDGAPSPDNQFDTLPATINAAQGLLIFPYLEPFGSRIAEIIDASNAPEADALKERYVFTDLYQKKPQQASLDTRHDVYRIAGEYRGTVQDFYDLGAYAGLVDGSVRVTSGGTPLREGTDFIVDYTSGSVQITNKSLLTAGRDIEISYEANQFMNLQKKTLLGARAEYAFGTAERGARSGNYLGATLMRLNERSPVDKFRIGEEPVSNLIWGFDGALNAEPRWLTRAVDALPFVQTKAPSSVSITGEFAQLRPSHVETIAFERTRDDLRGDGRDFDADELSGISYIDDFEGFENTFSLRQPNAWILSAPPDSIGGIDLDTGLPLTTPSSRNDSLRSTWRGTFAWYQINSNLLKTMADEGLYDVNDPDPAVSPVPIKEVFPNRDISAQSERFLPTMDLYFNPSERGPYNYTKRLDDFLAASNRKSVWGGMTQRLPDGYNEFDLKNIEFVEFIIKPFSDAPGGDAGEDAVLYMDLGSISEDIIPDGALNTEDGLSLTSPGNVSRWGRRPTLNANNSIDISKETGMAEDLGLDGLASYHRRVDDPADGPYERAGVETEYTRFADFIEAMRAFESHPDPLVRAEAQKALADPSGDDYHDFEDGDFFDRFSPGRASIQQRFSRFFSATELNSYEGQNQLAADSPYYADDQQRRTGNSRYPDSEDLNLNSGADTENSYYQYAVPLSRTRLAELARPENVDDYVVTEVSNGWYQIRIPVRNFTRRFGTITDFSLIESIRLWTTGHEAPATIRFASFELVGSQWQKSTSIVQELVEREGPLADTTSRLSISSVNFEENKDTYRVPLGAVRAQTRTATAGVQFANEQSLVIRVEDLGPGGQRGIFKTFQDYDLLKYERLRMYVHAHGRLADGTDLADLADMDLDEARSKARLFVRLGANEADDYYEYEQPLTPSREGTDTDELWRTLVSYNGEMQDLNSVLLDLGALNQLKVARDEYRDGDGIPFATDSLFWNAVEGGEALPGRPDISGKAPPGTRIGIKGNPSLANVRTIVIGVRNPADPTEAGLSGAYRIDDLTLWVNELRAAGYDARAGTAGLVNADIRFADLGAIKANFSMQTEGFGSLASTLGDRDLKALRNWAVTGDLNADKFLPERYGWRLPVSAQVQSATTTPSFAPSRGDVRVDEVVALIDEQEIDEAEKDRLKREAVESAQTYTASRSVNVRLSKQNSDSRVLRNTLDGVNLSYAFSDSDGRSPTQRLNDSWRWNGSASYTFTARPKTVRPLWFLDDLPVLDLVSGLRFNYAPQRIAAAGTAARTFSESQDRPRGVNALEPGDIPLPDLVAFPLREQQSFSHRRTTDVQYNPFGFLNLTFGTNTGQSLNGIAADTLNALLVYDEETGAYTRLQDMTVERALAEGRIDSSMIETTAFEIDNLELLPTGDIVRRLASGRADPRTEQYTQGFSATFQPKINKISALDWMTVGPFTYDVDFDWRNGPVGRVAGADVGNKVDLRAAFAVQPQSFWRKFGFYRDLEKLQTEYDRERQSEQQAREKARADRKEYRTELRTYRRFMDEQEDRLATLADSLAALPDSLGFTADSILAVVAADSALAFAEAPPEPTPPTVVVDSTDAGGFRLPLPNPGAFFRRSVLAFTGMRDFRVTYTGSRTARSTNVGALTEDDFGRQRLEADYTILDAVRGRGPSLGYRFGLDRRLPLDQRVLGNGLVSSDVLQDQNRIQATTGLNLTKTLQVNLNWNADWGTAENVSFAPLLDANNQPVLGPNGLPLPDTPTISLQGSNKASIWAFGADYLAFFERQYDALRSDRAAAADPTAFGDADGDGRVALTNEAVVADFLDTYVSGPGAVDRRGYLPFPMPSWNVTYSGLGDWPLLRRLVQSASLRHGYSADYSTDYSTNLKAATGDSIATIPLAGGPTLSFGINPYEARTVRINQRFAPLMQLDMTFKNRLSTSIAWNKSNAYTLSPINNEVGTLTTNEATLTASYRRQGLTIPFLPGRRLNNQITLSLTLSLSENDDRRYYLRRAIEASVREEGFTIDQALSGDNVTPSTAATRLSATPKLGYQFSNKVSADFTLTYERFDSADSRSPSFTSVAGGFNVRVSIAN